MHFLIVESAEVGVVTTVFLEFVEFLVLAVPVLSVGERGVGGPVVFVLALEGDPGHVAEFGMKFSRFRYKAFGLKL